MHLAFTQSVRPALRQELKQELRIVLELIMELLRLLRTEHRVTLGNVLGLRQAIGALSEDDRWEFAEHVVARTGEQAAVDLVAVLRAVTRGELGETMFPLAAFARDIEVLQRGIAKRVDHARGTALALRLVFRDPDFFDGRPGTPEELAALLNAVPQGVEHDAITWVLGGGWAVELLCEERLRDHHDIDTIVLTRKPLFLDTDIVHTDDYFGIIACTRRFFTERCVREVQGPSDVLSSFRGPIAVACSEFLFCSKFLRAPRDKDWVDVVALIRHFAPTWDIDLIRALMKRNCCDFTRGNDLLHILRTRDPERIISALQGFWPSP